MRNDAWFIKTKSLSNIGRAIKIYHIKRSRVIEGNIPVIELARALRDGEYLTEAPLVTEPMYKIVPSTLVDVADVVREIGGTTEEIAVEDLEGVIINLLEMLPDRKSVV